MPRIHVCSLTKIDETVRTTGARSLVTLMNPRYPLTRPNRIAADKHLHILVSDIVEPLDGHVLPEASHVRRLIDFMRAWDRAHPIVVHCYAGVSRSTAAAFIATCALRPDMSEQDIAARIRTLSPTATPNARLVAMADDLLAREGRMVAAISAIGRGVDCFEGVPFALDID